MANRDKFRLYSKKWRAENPGYCSAYAVTWRTKNPIRYRETKARWKRQNVIKTHVYNERRRARKANLPETLTEDEILGMISHFGGCALTGDSNYHLDHVIPLSSGCGGTTRGNVIPLRPDLNLSKSDSNLFVWFQSVRERFSLEERKFDQLVAYLAEANVMGISEYRDYVFSCFHTPNEEAA